jgi:hypothetical protein
MTAAPVRCAPKRDAQRPPDSRASLRGALRRSCRAESSPAGVARSGGNLSCRSVGGLWTASATQSARRPWAHRGMDEGSVRPYTRAATRQMRATLARAPCSTAASIWAMSRSGGLWRTPLQAPQAPTAVTHPATCVSRPGIHRSTCREDASASGPRGLRRWPRRGSRNRRPARSCRG